MGSKAALVTHQQWYSFVINEAPVPKGRPRFSTSHNSKRVVAYTPQRTRDYEKIVYEVAKQHISGVIDGDVHVYMQFIFPRPKRLVAKRHPDGLIPHDKRPDIDNLTKSVLDGLGKLLRDDAIVTKLSAEKHYAEREGSPRTIVTIIAHHKETHT